MRPRMGYQYAALRGMTDSSKDFARRNGTCVAVFTAFFVTIGLTIFGFIAGVHFDIFGNPAGDAQVAPDVSYPRDAVSAAAATAASAASAASAAWNPHAVAEDRDRAITVKYYVTTDMHVAPVPEVVDGDKAPTARLLINRREAVSTDTEAFDNPPDLPNPGNIAAKDQYHPPGGPWYYGPYEYYCGNFHTSDPNENRKGAYTLRIMNLTFPLTANGCNRAYCWGTTAIYACNDLAAPQSVTGYALGWMADRLDMLCCDPDHGKSAQMFHPTEGWNAVIGYGNCEHDPSEPPADFGTTNGGVNGDCLAFTPLRALPEGAGAGSGVSSSSPSSAAPEATGSGL